MPSGAALCSLRLGLMAFDCLAGQVLGSFAIDSEIKTFRYLETCQWNPSDRKQHCALTLGHLLIKLICKELLGEELLSKEASWVPWQAHPGEGKELRFVKVQVSHRHATQQVASPTEGPGQRALPELTAPSAELHVFNFQAKFTLSWSFYQNPFKTWSNDAGASQQEASRPPQLL